GHQLAHHHREDHHHAQPPRAHHRRQRTETENFVDPLPAGPSQVTVTWRVPASGNSMVPRYRPGVLSGASVAPAIIGAMPDIVMLVFRLTLPASTGFLSVADVISRTNSFLPFFHCPDSLISVTTTSFVFCVWIGFMSAASATPAPIASTPVTMRIAIIRIIVRVSSPLVVVTRPSRSQSRPPSHRSFVASLLGLRSPKVPLPQPVEDDGCHDKDEA